MPYIYYSHGSKQLKDTLCISSLNVEFTHQLDWLQYWTTKNGHIKYHLSKQMQMDNFQFNLVIGVTRYKVHSFIISLCDEMQGHYSGVFL